MIFLGTLLMIHLNMPTNRRLPPLQVHREVDMFWESTRFSSAWLVSALRAHGVCWSDYLCLWPGANQRSPTVTWIVHQFSGNKQKKKIGTCILLARSTFKVIPIWLHSLEDTRSSCAGSKWQPHHLMLYGQTRGDLHSLDKGRYDSDGVDPHHLHDPTTQIRAATIGGQAGDVP